MNRTYLKIILVAACLFVNGLPQAAAANWHAAVEVDQGTIYVDIDSVKKNPDNMTFWNDDRFISGRSAGRKMTCLTEVAFSQGKKLMRDVQCTHYDKDGNAYGTEKTGAWEAVTPGSAMEVAIKVAALYAR